MSALTLPGSIPGLLRRGSPVTHTHDGGWVQATVVLRAGMVTEVYIGQVQPPAWRVELATDSGLWAPLGTIALDLTDATGRAHAAWWLAGRLLPGGSFELARWRFSRESIGWWIDSKTSATRYNDVYRAFWPKLGQDEGSRVHVPSLADIDPNDPRLLPDGSRWVDAEALRRVCLHVAGLS